VQPFGVFMFGWGGVAAVVGVLSAALVVQAIIFALFAIETRQRTLESLAVS
jgi:hypothetical protein